MFVKMLTRLRDQEDGYSLVISILLVAIMMVLMVVSVDAGTASLKQSTLGTEWSKTLTIAEQGVNDAAARLGQSRAAANPCPISSTSVCSATDGQYQLSWSTVKGKILITSVGYYPAKAAQKFSREVQATYAPVKTFTYAIFSRSSLAIKNGATVIGDVYSDGPITIESGAKICGSVTSSGGGISLGSNSQVLTTNGGTCTDKTGKVWSGGSAGIVGQNGVTVGGDVVASAPAAVTCPSASGTYGVTNSGGSTGFTIQGAVRACGAISGTSGQTSSTAGVFSPMPAPVTFPAFSFDPANYSSVASDPLHLQCYPSGGTCGANDATDSVAQFNSYIATHISSLTGTFAVWQRSPAPMVSPGLCTTASTTQICLSGLTNLSGDFTLITNAPVDFGNTNTISTNAASADMVVISTYIPGSGTACDTNGGDCSIYGKNSITFDAGSASDPNDGVVGLLYTTGKMAFDNGPHSGTPPEGALYAESMNFKNNYDIEYNARIERVLGFGKTYERVLWQEIND